MCHCDIIEFQGQREAIENIQKRKDSYSTYEQSLDRQMTSQQKQWETGMMILKGWEKNYCQPRQLPENDNICQKMLSCKNQSEIKIFSENQKLRKLTANRQ